MCRAELGLEFITVAGLQVGYKIIDQDAGQQIVMKRRDIAAIIDFNVRPVSAKCIPQGTQCGRPRFIGLLRFPYHSIHLPRQAELPAPGRSLGHRPALVGGRKPAAEPEHLPVVIGNGIPEMAVGASR